MRRSSNRHEINLEVEKVIDDTARIQQVTSQAITFGWTQYNRHKDLSPYIPTLYIDASKFGLFLYKPEKDSLFVTENPFVFTVDFQNFSFFRKEFWNRCNMAYSASQIIFSGKMLQMIHMIADLRKR